MLFNISVVQNKTDNLTNKIIQSESQTWENAQYSRWEYLGAVDIPESISDEKLEGKICQSCNKIGANIESKELTDCHALKKG